MGNVLNAGCDPVALLTCDMFYCFGDTLESVRDVVAKRYEGERYQLEAEYRKFLSWQPHQPVVLLPGYMGNELRVTLHFRVNTVSSVSVLQLYLAGDSFRG